MEQVAQGAGDLVALGDIADAERGKAAQKAEDDGKPFPALADSVFNIVHRAAVVGAVFILHAVLHGQKDLGILGDHAEEGGYPHPEDRARAAGEDGAGHAGDVSGADRARQSGGDRLEGRNVRTMVGLLFLLAKGCRPCSSGFCRSG